MASIATGKDRAALLIRQYAEELKPTEPLSILDVGACDGVWSDLIRREVVPYVQAEIVIDAVEGYKPNAERILYKYRNLFIGPMQAFRYDAGQYDIAIFGDVIEHMAILDAQVELELAQENCEDAIVAVPYRYPQGAIYGNSYEVHVQDDLTPEIMAERYPLLELLFEAQANYAYYHFKGGAIGGRR